MRKAFTIVELLVSISIIAILATLVTLNLSAAQRASRDARRQTDVKAYSAAMEKYHLASATYFVNSDSCGKDTNNTPSISDVSCVGAEGRSYGRINFKGAAQDGGIAYAQNPQGSTLAEVLLKGGYTSKIARDPLNTKADTEANQPDYVLVRCDGSGVQARGLSDESFSIFTKFENTVSDVASSNTANYCGGTNTEFGSGTFASSQFSEYRSSGSASTPSKYYAASSGKVAPNTNTSTVSTVTQTPTNSPPALQSPAPPLPPVRVTLTAMPSSGESGFTPTLTATVSGKRPGKTINYLFFCDSSSTTSPSLDDANRRFDNETREQIEIEDCAYPIPNDQVASAPISGGSTMTWRGCVDGSDEVIFNRNSVIKVNHNNFDKIGSGSGCGGDLRGKSKGITTGSIDATCKTVRATVSRDGNSPKSVPGNRVTFRDSNYFGDSKGTADTLDQISIYINDDGPGGDSDYAVQFSCADVSPVATPLTNFTAKVIIEHDGEARVATVPITVTVPPVVPPANTMTWRGCVDGSDEVIFNRNSVIKVNHNNFDKIGSGSGCGGDLRGKSKGITTGSIDATCKTVRATVSRDGNSPKSVPGNRVTFKDNSYENGKNGTPDTLDQISIYINDDGPGGDSDYKVEFSCI